MNNIGNNQTDCVNNVSIHRNLGVLKQCFFQVFNNLSISTFELIIYISNRSHIRPTYSISNIVGYL